MHGHFDRYIDVFGPSQDTLCIGLACEQHAVTLCYHVVVAKCKYCLGVGETIMHAAARYQTDWLQLWGANTQIRLDPQSQTLNSLHTDQVRFLILTLHHWHLYPQP
jgi:hypothetical protein